MSREIRTTSLQSSSSQPTIPLQQSVKWTDVLTNTSEMKGTCHAINEKGRKCTRRCKEDTNYCGKHKEANDHSFDSYITVTLQILDDIPYYVDKNGIVFNYSLENIRMVGYIDPATHKLIKIDYNHSAELASSSSM